MTQQTNKPSDPIDNPWDDMNVTPVAPLKDHHAAGDLYTNKPGNSSEGLGLAFAWLGHPLALPFILAGAVLLGIINVMANYSQNAEREAAKKMAIADLAIFQKTRSGLGYAGTCLAIEQKHVPVQYAAYCRVIKAADKAKKARK